MKNGFSETFVDSYINKFLNKVFTHKRITQTA